MIGIATLQTCVSDAQVPAHGSFTPDALRRCICANFAASKDASTDEQGLLLDRAFSALRILSEQMHMQQCSCHAVTGGIQVEVTSAFIGVSENRLDESIQCHISLLYVAAFIEPHHGTQHLTNVAAGGAAEGACKPHGHKHKEHVHVSGENHKHRVSKHHTRVFVHAPNNRNTPCNRDLSYQLLFAALS